MCPGKNLSGALQIGTEIPMHVKSAMSEFYISSGSLFKQLWYHSHLKVIPLTNNHRESTFSRHRKANVDFSFQIGFTLRSCSNILILKYIDRGLLCCFAPSENAFCEKGVKGAMQCVTDSASTIGLWASSSCSRSTQPALQHYIPVMSRPPPLINIFGQVCPSDCHWSYRPRPRPVNWHWTDVGGEMRRQLTSLTDFWHNFLAANGRHTRPHCFENQTM